MANACQNHIENTIVLHLVDSCWHTTLTFAADCPAFAEEIVPNQQVKQQFRLMCLRQVRGTH